MQVLCTTLRFSPYFQGYFHDLFRFCLVFSSLIRTSELPLEGTSVRQ